MRIREIRLLQIVGMAPTIRKSGISRIVGLKSETYSKVKTKRPEAQARAEYFPPPAFIRPRTKKYRPGPVTARASECDALATFQRALGGRHRILSRTLRAAVGGGLRPSLTGHAVSVNIMNLEVPTNSIPPLSIPFPFQQMYQYHTALYLTQLLRCIHLEASLPGWRG